MPPCSKTWAEEEGLLQGQEEPLVENQPFYVPKLPGDGVDRYQEFQIQEAVDEVVLAWEEVVQVRMTCQVPFASYDL